MHVRLTLASIALPLAAVACNGVESALQPPYSINASKGTPGGGTPTPPPSTTPAPAPSGGTQIPPSPTADGPAWFFSEIGGTAGPSTANVNFDSMQNQSPGGIAVGTSRIGEELIYNVSKKTALTITNITFVGANPGDFSIPAADLSAALSTALPPNQGAAEALHVVFTPTAAGPRSATLEITSAAGIAEIFLTGTGLAQQPVISPIAPLNFITGSAPITITVSNLGGQTLAIKSINIVGQDLDAFQLVPANFGQSNCFAGELLAPKSSCLLAIGLASFATGPARAALAIVTNDPATPTLNVPLTFSP